MAARPFNTLDGLSVGELANIIIHASGLVSAAMLTVDGTSNLGDVANVKITGGTNGQILSTDGTGNLSWKSGGGGGSGFFFIGTRYSGNVMIDVLSGSFNIVGRTGNVPVYIT